MDVKSVNNPAVQPAPAPKRSAEVRPEPVRDNNKAQDNEARKAAQAQAQQSKPVVNTQGQVTGRHLNVTA